MEHNQDPGLQYAYTLLRSDVSSEDLSYVRMYVLGGEYTDSYRMTLPPVTCILSSKYAVRYHIFSEDPIES